MPSHILNGVVYGRFSRPARFKNVMAASALPQTFNSNKGIFVNET